MPTAYNIDAYTVKVTVNGQNQPVLQVVDRTYGTVAESLSLISEAAEIYTEDTDFYIVGSGPTEDHYVNSVDPSENDVQISTSGELVHINGSNIPLEVYNAYLKYEEGVVNFYEQVKDQQCLRKAS